MQDLLGVPSYDDLSRAATLPGGLFPLIPLDNPASAFLQDLLTKVRVPLLLCTHVWSSCRRQRCVLPSTGGEPSLWQGMMRRLSCHFKKTVVLKECHFRSHRAWLFLRGVPFQKPQGLAFSVGSAISEAAVLILRVPLRKSHCSICKSGAQVIPKPFQNTMVSAGASPQS